MLKNPITRTGLVLTLLLALSACVSVPLDQPRTASYAIPASAETRLAVGREQWLAGDTTQNGFYPLTSGLDALGTRLRLMDVAEVSIDAQYFLMKPDHAGLVFSDELIEAAERGVRVRLLLDDIFTTVDDNWLQLIDRHPNIELRVFNPISRRGLFALNYAGNFKLTNRRMHNKTFTVDNTVSVIGGRNIAVEYFQLETTGEFIDFDMLATGPIIEDISASFDDYWNHQLSIPLEQISPGLTDQEAEDMWAQWQVAMEREGFEIYDNAENTPLMGSFLRHEIKPFRAKAELLVDSPEKLLNKVADDQKLVVRQLIEAFNAAEEEIVLFTPYFIPRKEGLEYIRELRKKGIRIVVVTNSLATNNHKPVHSAYASYRKDLLRAGVELWEARADAAVYVKDVGTTSDQKLTLHTKGVLIDHNKMFVGSLNFDPRSLDLNSEIGLLLESEELVTLASASSKKSIPLIAWQLKLDEKDRITWHANIDGEQVVKHKEPLTTGWERFIAWLLKIAPENQL